MTKYFIERSKVTNMIIFFIFLAGLLSVISLPRQDMPNVNFNVLTIQTVYPGASPADVEVNVTDRIEDELENVDGIEDTSSFSMEGMSFIFVQIDPNLSDTSQVEEDVRSAVDRVNDLPAAITEKPVVKEMKSTDFPVVEIAISGAGEAELRKIAKDFESDVRELDNVGAVEKVGYRKREVHIEADLNKMEKEHVSFSEILSAIKTRNIKISGGTLESFVNEKNIITFSEFEKLQDVKDVIVRSNYTGKQIRVSDIARVDLGYKKRQIYSRTNGEYSVNVIVKRKGTADVVNLSNEVGAIIEEYQRSFKDRGIEITKVVDFSYYTKSLLNIVSINAIIGFVLVISSLFIFLNLKSAMWVAFGIPLSILGAYIFLPVVDVNTNQITLVTMIMVLGMLVDDAIVIAENITRHQEGGMDLKKAALKGTQEVFKPVLATILTTILCFVPMYFMKGILGKFIMTIPTVVILTLAFSLFESTTILPAHLSYGTHTTADWKLSWINALRFRYGKLLHFFLKFKKLALTGFIGVSLLLGVIFFQLTKFELFPTEDYDLFYIVMETPIGTSLDETLKKVKPVEEKVKEISPDLLMSFTTIIGHHRTVEAKTDPSIHENWALISVYLHPASRRSITSEEIIDNLKKSVTDTSSFSKFVIREMQDGPPVGDPITIRLVSDDFDVSKKYEAKLLDYIKNIKGVYDLESSNQVGKNEVRLKLDYSFMARTGITAAQVANTIRIAYDGEVATSLRRNGEEIDFRVFLKPEQRKESEVLQNLLIRNAGGHLLKLSKFVTFEEGKSSQVITHYNGKKSISITAKVNTDVITSIEANRQIREKFLTEINGTPGLSIVFGGEEKETEESMRNFSMAFIVALIGIFCVLVLLLNSWWQPLLIMVAIPFGLVGVIIAFALHGHSLSFMGLIGTLGMIGVVVNDSLVMVTHLNQMRVHHNRLDKYIVVEAAKTRLRPVLLTTITTVLGLVPTVYGWGGYEPFLVPMVLAMSWGLVFATVITLVLIPILYFILGSWIYRKEA